MEVTDREQTEDEPEWAAEMREAVKDLKAMVVSADDQIRALTDAELGIALTSGKWEILHVHEAGRRLLGR